MLSAALHISLASSESAHTHARRHTLRAWRLATPQAARAGCVRGGGRRVRPDLTPARFRSFCGECVVKIHEARWFRVRKPGRTPGGCRSSCTGVPRHPAAGTPRRSTLRFRLSSPRAAEHVARFVARRSVRRPARYAYVSGLGFHGTVLYRSEVTHARVRLSATLKSLFARR